MIDIGDIHLTDLNEEQRRLVIVVSTNRFHHKSGRALVAPQGLGPPRTVSQPWRIRIGDVHFRVDHVRSVALDRLLDRVDRAPAGAVAHLRRTLHTIT